MSATYINEGDCYEKDEKSTVASCTYSILERHKNWRYQKSIVNHTRDTELAMDELPSITCQL